MDLIILFIRLFLKEIKVQASERRVKVITCPHCGGDYAYEVQRTVEASATAFRFTPQPALMAKAQRRAEKKLQKTLDNDVASIPCPDCGMYGRAMARKLKRKAFTVVVAAVVIAFVVSVFIWSLSDPFVGVIPPTLASLFLGILWLSTALIALWALFHNPNRNPHSRTRQALGTKCLAIPLAELHQALAEERDNPAPP